MGACCSKKPQTANFQDPPPTGNQQQPAAPPMVQTRSAATGSNPVNSSVAPPARSRASSAHKPGDSGSADPGQTSVSRTNSRHKRGGSAQVDDNPPGGNRSGGERKRAETASAVAFPGQSGPGRALSHSTPRHKRADSAPGGPAIVSPGQLDRGQVGRRAADSRPVPVGFPESRPDQPSRSRASSRSRQTGTADSAAPRSRAGSKAPPVPTIPVYFPSTLRESSSSSPTFRDYTPEHLGELLLINSKANDHTEHINIVSAQYCKQAEAPNREFIIFRIRDTSCPKLPGLVDSTILERMLDVPQGKTGVAEDNFRIPSYGDADSLVKSSGIAKHQVLESLDLTNWTLPFYNLITLASVVSSEQNRYALTISECRLFPSLVWSCLRGMSPTQRKSRSTAAGPSAQHSPAIVASILTNARQRTEVYLAKLQTKDREAKELANNMQGLDEEFRRAQAEYDALVAAKSATQSKKT